MKFIHPKLPDADALLPYLRQIDARRVYTNRGPQACMFETLLATRIGGRFVLTNNCTTALMVALAAVKTPRRKYAIMPSFTFAATAQAAVWAGYEPYFVDIDTDLFVSEARVQDALESVGGQAVVAPCATFGEPFRLDFYNEMVKAGTPVVVDAAAAFGAEFNGRAWGDGFNGVMTYSFHATKPYGIGEGGAIRCYDWKLSEHMRSMTQFGFVHVTARSAVHLGLNGKMSEYQAAVGQAVDAAWDARRAHLMALKARYGAAFGEIVTGGVPAFYPRLYETAEEREAAQKRLDKQKIGWGRYFVPPVHQQPAFADCRRGTMQMTEDVADRILCLPLTPTMTIADVERVLVETIT